MIKKNITKSIREKGWKLTHKSTSAAAAFPRLCSALPSQGSRFRGAECPSGEGGGLQVSWAQQVLCSRSTMTMVGGWSWWFCLFLCWSPPGAASTPSFRLPWQCSSVLRAGYMALTQAELCTPCRAAPGPPGCCESRFPAPGHVPLWCSGSREGVVHSAGLPACPSQSKVHKPLSQVMQH